MRGWRVKLTELPLAAFVSRAVNSLRMRLHLSLLTAFFVTASRLAAAEPLYANDFQSTEKGKLPEGFLVMAGSFAVQEEGTVKAVQEEGTAKYLELPGDPLDTFGVLFGPAQPPAGNVTAKFYGTKQGRKQPAFGISLGGVGGYRLLMSGNKKALEIVKGDETRSSAPFTWEPGTWLSLRIRVSQSGSGWLVEGKAWPAAAPEPAVWGIRFESKEAPPAGRPAIWGTPYSGTPIRFDDLRLEGAP